MARIIDFPLQKKRSGGLTRDNMDWPKLVNDVQKSKRLELENTLWPMHAAIVKMLSLPSKSSYTAERIRFLNKVKCAMEAVLMSDKDAVEYPLYYILIYFLEDGDAAFYSTIDDDNIVHFQCDDTVQNRTIAYMLNQFRGPDMRTNISRLEEFLVYLLR